MSIVKDFIKTKFADGDIGLEIEVEGARLPIFIENNYWRIDNDGSLRGESFEYVLKTPLSMEKVKNSLDFLAKAYKDNKSVPRESFRAGVHVHVNCQKLSMVELFNFITLYLIFEEVFIRWCGETREGNLFCLRTSDAEYVMDEVRNALVFASAHKSLSRFFGLIYNEDFIRYSSINLAALGKYGSLEFRAMRSTPNMDLIYGWADVLLRLREVAKTYSDPQSIMHEFSVSGIDKFVASVLGTEVANMFGTTSVEGRNDIISGVRNAQEIAFSGNWEIIASIIPDKDRQLDAIMAGVAIKPRAKKVVHPRLEDMFLDFHRVKNDVVVKRV